MVAVVDWRDFAIRAVAAATVFWRTFCALRQGRLFGANEREALLMRLEMKRATINPFKG